MSKNQPISAGLIGPPGTVMEGQPQTISYPNNIQDHQTVVKLREIIDHLNQTKTHVAANQTSTAANTQAIDDAIKRFGQLPSSFLTPSDVNAQINIALGTNGTITSYVVKLLKASGVSVPDRLPPFP